jgi:hypothetical protein
MKPILFSSSGAQFDKYHPTEEQYQLILKYADSSVKREDLFTIERVACDNVIDRHNEEFQEQSLRKISGQIAGTPAMLNHRLSLEYRWGKNYYGSYKIDQSKRGGQKNINDDIYKYVYVLQYTTRDEDKLKLLSDMVSGIDDKVSVGFTFDISHLKCSICNENMWEIDWDTFTFKCPHVAGRFYDGKLCYGKFVDINEILELSNVVIPAQPGAGTIKSITNITDKKTREIVGEQLREMGNSFHYDDWNSGIRRAYKELKETSIKREKIMSVPSEKDLKNKNEQDASKDQVDNQPTVEIVENTVNSVEEVKEAVQQEALKAQELMKETQDTVNELKKGINELVEKIDKMDEFNALIKSLDEKFEAQTKKYEKTSENIEALKQASEKLLKDFDAIRSMEKPKEQKQYSVVSPEISEDTLNILKSFKE